MGEKVESGGTIKRMGIRGRGIRTQREYCNNIERKKRKVRRRFNIYYKIRSVRKRKGWKVGWPEVVEVGQRKVDRGKLNNRREGS